VVAPVSVSCARPGETVDTIVHDPIGSGGSHSITCVSMQGTLAVYTQ